METLMIKSKFSFQQFLQSLNISTSTEQQEKGPRPSEAPQQAGDAVGLEPESSGPGDRRTMGHNQSLATSTAKPRDEPYATTQVEASNLTAYADNTTGDYFPSYWTGGDDLAWNGSYPANTTNYTSYNISDLELFNVNNGSVPYGFWFCAKWVEAQQDLFQAANLCFAVAFLIPKSFKQSILIVRALAAAGFLLLAAWAGTELCAPDVLAWNIVLVLVNSVHTILLIIRFLPPALSLELTELYLKLFKPLKVNKKHFRELAKEARLLKLEPGEPYSIEGVTSADERLSILLKGKLKVSCEQTYLHMIQPHQFVDSPEWEANREQSDDVFQVTIIAEELSTCLCWPRMRLERVLRHRPMLKIVLDSIIGKDITHKLYSLNEQQALSGGEIRVETETRIILRSLSADAVDVGARGRVRSSEWRAREKKGHATSDKTSPARASRQPWQPVASQFPPQSPFASRANQQAARQPPYSHLTVQASSSSLPFPSANTPLLSPPPKRSLRKTASFRKNREVKFMEPHETTL